MQERRARIPEQGEGVRVRVVADLWFGEWGICVTYQDETSGLNQARARAVQVASAMGDGVPSGELGDFGWYLDTIERRRWTGGVGSAYRETSASWDLWLMGSGELVVRVSGSDDAPTIRPAVDTDLASLDGPLEQSEQTAPDLLSASFLEQRGAAMMPHGAGATRALDQLMAQPAPATRACPNPSGRDSPTRTPAPGQRGLGDGKRVVLALLAVLVGGYLVLAGGYRGPIAGLILVLGGVTILGLAMLRRRRRR